MLITSCIWCSPFRHSLCRTLLLVLSFCITERGFCCCSDSQSYLFATPWTATFQASLSFTISWSWCRFMFTEVVILSISSSAAPLSFCLQSFPSSGSFPMSRLFTSGGQSIGASASASVLPVNIQGWVPLWLTGLISLQSNGLSRVFFSTKIWKHQSFGTQPYLWSNSQICTWLL